MQTRTGYCPNCKKNVLTKREDVNWALAIFLLIFTSGLGLLIYLVIYFDKDEIYCVHCGTKCSFHPYQVAYQAPQQLTNYARESQQLILQENYHQDPVAKYCPFCGFKIGNRNEVKYCALCGAEV